jgi:hypothetical protein
MLSLTSLRFVCRALAVLAVPALLAAGCGGLPSIGNQDANQNSDAQTLKFVQCMQQHGINAQSGNNGHSVAIRAHVGDKNAPSQQQVQAAQQACKQYEPGGGKSSGQPNAQQMDQMTKYVQCVNQHGGNAKVQGNGIEEGPGPGGPEQQRQADQACQKYMPH